MNISSLPYNLISHVYNNRIFISETCKLVVKAHQSMNFFM